MTVEAASFVNQLNPALPTQTDYVYEGDNHDRLIKAVLVASLPNIGGPVMASHTDLSQLAGKVPLLTDTPGQIVLMSAVAVTGSPSAIDFVNGSGGVTISNAYSEYLLTFEYIHHASSSNAKLRVLLSQDAGATWTIPVSSISNATTSSTATPATLDFSSAAYFPVMGELANSSLLPGSGGAGVAGQVQMMRATTADRLWLHSWMVGQNASARRGIETFGSTTSPVNGIRLAWDTGAFGNTGTVKLFGRKA